MKKLPDYLRRAHKLSTKKGWKWEHLEGSKHLSISDADGNFIVNLSLSAYDGTLRKQVLSKLRKAKCPGVQ